MSSGLEVRWREARPHTPVEPTQKQVAEQSQAAEAPSAPDLRPRWPEQDGHGAHGPSSWLLLSCSKTPPGNHLAEGPTATRLPHRCPSQVGAQCPGVSCVGRCPGLLTSSGLTWTHLLQP